MKSLTIVLLLTASVAFISHSATAACGAGGWRPPGTPGATGPLILDMSHFEIIGPHLAMTEEQSKGVAKAAAEVNEAITKLNAAQTLAETGLKKCQGACPEEQKAVKLAYEAMEKFNPDAEIEKRLSKVMDESQFHKYQIMKLKLARSTTPRMTTAPAPAPLQQATITLPAK